MKRKRLRQAIDEEETEEHGQKRHNNSPDDRLQQTDHDNKSQAAEDVVDDRSADGVTCGRCKKNTQEDVFRWTCDDCGIQLCGPDCMGIAPIQWLGGLCKECFDFECWDCDAPLDNTITYCSDGDPMPFCKQCSAKNEEKEDADNGAEEAEVVKTSPVIDRPPHTS